MIMFEAEPIRDSQGNQWSKTELKCWRSARQLFQVHYVIQKNFSTLDGGENSTWLTQQYTQCRATVVDL